MAIYSERLEEENRALADIVTEGCFSQEKQISLLRRIVLIGFLKKYNL